MHNAFEPKGLNPDIKMIVPSQFLKNYYQAYLPDADIVIVDNGIDLDAYQSDCSSQLRSELNLSTRDKVIFYAGRIVPDKGVLLLLKAFEKLVEEQSDLKLVVVGDHMEVSKSDKGAYQQEVRDVAARMQNKCLMLGSIPPEKMHLYYPLADLVVIPSQFKEPFCMVAIEAMGAGKPVLVSTRGGMVEFVKSEETGYHLREPMSVDSIAQDIKDVLARKDLHRTAEQGQNQIFERYSWSSVTQSFEAVIHNWFD